MLGIYNLATVVLFTYKDLIDKIEIILAVVSLTHIIGSCNKFRYTNMYVSVTPVIFPRLNLNKKQNIIEQKNQCLQQQRLPRVGKDGCVYGAL